MTIKLGVKNKKEAVQQLLDDDEKNRVRESITPLIANPTQILDIPLDTTTTTVEEYGLLTTAVVEERGGKTNENIKRGSAQNSCY